MKKEFPIAALYPLRALALSTRDPLAAQVVLKFLGESEEEARTQLAASCWGEDLVPGKEVENLRAALG
jgi:hypothetical protein